MFTNMRIMSTDIVLHMAVQTGFLSRATLVKNLKHFFDDVFSLLTFLYAECPFYSKIGICPRLTFNCAGST